MVLAILLNYIWASPSPDQGPKFPMISLEGLYSYLYAVSILILAVCIIPSFLPQAIREKLHLTMRERKSFGWSVLIITVILGTFSIIYCVAELAVVQMTITLEQGSSQKVVDKVFIMKVNSVLASLLIFLEMFYLYKSKQGELFYPLAVEGLYEVGKRHLLATNVCLWIKILTKETVVFALEQTYIEDDKNFLQYTIQFNGTNYSVPAFPDPCDAFACFSNHYDWCGNYSRSLWTLEEGFSCKKFSNFFNNHTVSHLSPFLSEFSTLMICILIEMLDEEPEENVPPPTSTMRMSHVDIPGLGLLLGLIPLILVGILLIVDLNKQQPYLYALLTTLILVSVVFAFIHKARTSLTSRSIHSPVDENILFITSFGFLLYLTAYMIPHILLPPTGSLEKNCYEIVLCTTAILTTMLQVILICNLLNKTIPPGQNALRNTLAFIAMCNLSFWIYDSLLNHKQSQSDQREYYGLYSWAFLWRIACPLLVFFRFHSFVILIQVAWQAPRT